MENNTNFTFDQIALGRRIEDARKARGMETKQVGAAMGVTTQAVRNWERGDRRLNARRAIELSKLLNISLNFMLTGVEYSGALTVKH